MSGAPASFCIAAGQRLQLEFTSQLPANARGALARVPTFFFKVTKGSFSSLSSITALAVFFSFLFPGWSALKCCQSVFLVMIIYFGGGGGGPLEEVWVRLRGFESPLVHLLGLVYDACCLPAFVVGRRYGACYLAVPGNQPRQTCKLPP